MKITIKKLSAFLLAVLFFSCSKEQENSYESHALENKELKLSFANFEEFENKINELSQKNDGDLETWIREYNPNALLIELKNDTLIDSFYEYLPNAYKAVFDKEGEITVNNKKVRLVDGNLYEYSTEKSFDHGSKLIGSISIDAIDTKTKKNLALRTYLDGNDLDAKYQHEFWGSRKEDCSGNNTNMYNSNYKYKYVHELYTVTTRHGSTGISRLYLRMKLEYKFKRRDWKRAGEKRDINVSMNLQNISFTNRGFSVPISGQNFVNHNFNCTNDREILLKYTPNSFIWQSGDILQWSVSTSGTITHQIHGGYNKWVNNAIW